MDAPASHRQVRIATLPTGALRSSDFEVVTAEVERPGDGELLCRTLAITIGAGQRAGLQGSAGYAGAPVAGRVMGGTGVAEVVASGAASVPNGSLVWAPTGWQEWSVQRASAVSVLDPGADPATALGVLGTNGLTAFFGVTEIGRVAAGETFVVSAAAGSVGHLAGQIAGVLGARVVGVVGSDSKARMLVDELGFGAAVNRRSDTFRAAFKDATPGRIDVYFDNTGGGILESALFRMNRGGRIVCCGVASQYDTSTPGPGPRGVPGLLVNNRVRMEGFLVFDFEDRYAPARERLSAWVAAGRIRPLVTAYDGLHEAPQAFVDLLAGETVGTTVVRVG
jgi:hypothetical protein